MKVKNTVKVYLKDGRIWNFVWDDACSGFVHRTAKNVYKIFAESNHWGVDVWIGKKVKCNHNVFMWAPYDRKAGACKVDYLRGKLTFKQFSRRRIKNNGNG